MAEPVSGAISAAETLLQTVMLAKGIWDGKSQTFGEVAAELHLFVSNLEDNVKLLRDNKSAQSNSATWASDALQQDLRQAAKDGHKILGKGFFESVWDATRIQSELRVLRERVMASFQTTIVLAALDVAIESNEEQEEFQEALLRLQNLLRAHTTSSAPTLKSLVPKELEGFWKPVFAQLQKHENKLEDAMLLLKFIKPQTDDTQKFFANVLGELEKAQRDRRAAQQGRPSATTKWYHDPITREIMCDPVKASDRRTYDRWTLIDNRSSLNPPLKVVLDDIDVRSRLFQKFPDQEQKYRARRSEYRQQALQKASRGDYSEALLMLNNVLGWAEDDSECKARRDEVQRLLDLTAPDVAPENDSKGIFREDQMQHPVDIDSAHPARAGRPGSQPPPGTPAAGASSSDMVERLRHLLVNLDTLPWPSKLDISSCNENLLSFSVDCLVARYVRKQVDSQIQVGAVQADYPAPCGKSRPAFFYFEMDVKYSGKRGEISIGFADKEHFEKEMHVGWNDNTCGYHGDNGELYRASGAGKPFGPKFSAGDVVGAGIHYGTNQLFFVRNGELVGCVPNFLKGHLLYPTLALTTYSQTVKVNFGRHGFSNIVQDTWFT